MAQPFPNHPNLEGGFAPIHMECDYPDLVVEGEIPQELRQMLTGLKGKGMIQRFLKRWGAEIDRLSSLSTDRYSLIVRTTAKAGSNIRIQLEARAAKRLGKSEHDAMNHPEHFSLASNEFDYYYLRKTI